MRGPLYTCVVCQQVVVELGDNCRIMKEKTREGMIICQYYYIVGQGQNIWHNLFYLLSSSCRCWDWLCLVLSLTTSIVISYHILLISFPNICMFELTSGHTWINPLYLSNILYNKPPVIATEIWLNLISCWFWIENLTFETTFPFWIWTIWW